MYFDVFLLSVIVVTIYLGPMILRRLPPGERLYGWMLVLDGGLAGVSLYARNSGGGETADLLGFLAIGAAVFLILVPPVLRDLARRAMLGDHLRVAARLIELRELLQPGMGAARELELLQAVIAVRAGKVEEAVHTLRETRASVSDPMARKAIDERIVFTYLSARQWQDAIREYEACFPDQLMTPQLLVEMVRAYCEVGNLDAAASLVDIVDGSPLASEPFWGLLIDRARLMFLAYLGRAQAVEHLVGKAGPLALLPAGSRHFWTGMARMRAGDQPGARAALKKAVRQTRNEPRAREVAERMLAAVESGEPLPEHTASAATHELADRIAAEVMTRKAEPRHAVPLLSGVPWSRIPVTLGLVLANVGVSALVTLLLGSTGDPGVLIRAGADVKSAVHAGEWWRLSSSIFLQAITPLL